MAQNKGTSNPGFVSTKGQVVREKTNWPGKDHNQVICIMHCKRCGFCYGVNSSDTHHRNCPNCMGGVPCSYSECPAKPEKGNCDRCRSA